MKIKIKEKSNSVIITISGSIKSGLEFYLAVELDKHLNKHIYIEMREVHSVNSAFLGVLLDINKQLLINNRSLIIFNPSSMVRNLLKVTRINNIITIRKGEIEEDH